MIIFSSTRLILFLSSKSCVDKKLQHDILKLILNMIYVFVSVGIIR
jgi:hypothetical protein